MAQRRMFNKDVIETDWFTDMPATTQLLYIHLSMQADDDGFVTNTKVPLLNAHAGKDDLSVLIAKNYVIKLEAGLYLLKHWRQNNYLRNDRYKPSDYADRLVGFTVKQDGSYTEKKSMDTTGIPSGNPQTPQGEEGYTQSGVYPEEDRLGKVRLGNKEVNGGVGDEPDPELQKQIEIAKTRWIDDDDEDDGDSPF